MILSMAMMLRHSFGLEEEAQAVEQAVEGVLSEGYRTPDIAGDGGDVIGTERMGASPGRQGVTFPIRAIRLLSNRHAACDDSDS